jgi:hypothetical protein
MQALSATEKTSAEELASIKALLESMEKKK